MTIAGSKRLAMRLVGLPALLSGASLWAVAAHAEAPTATEELTANEIVVTASRREQSLVEVPSAVTAVSGDVLNERGLTDIRDFAALVPGFSLDDRGGTDVRLILRGQNTGGAGASVATMMDDVVLSSTSALSNGSTVTPNFETYDLERVEVLRGPQGTLYGATAQGGLVKYVTKKPDLAKAGAAAEVGFESVNQGETAFNGRAVVNIPLITDKLAIRAAGYYIDLPGYIDNPLLGLKDVNRGNRRGGRVSLLAKPTDRLSIRVTGAYQNEEYGAEGVVEVVGSPVPGSETSRSFDLVGGTPSDRKGFQGGNRARSRFINGVIDWDVGFADLTSSTSLVKVSRRQGFDISNGPVAPFVTLGAAFGGLFGEPITLPLVQDNDHKKFNQEVRLSSKKGVGPSWLTWQVGVFHSYEDVLFNQDFVVRSAADASRVLTVLPFIPGIGGLGLGGQRTDANYNEWSGFGDVTFKFGRFELSLGGRYTDIRQDGVVTNFPGVFTGPPSAADPTIAGAVPFVSKENKFTYSVAPRFAVTDRISLYSRIASGYRPGGPLTVPGAGTNGIPRSFRPDNTVNYEVGTKGDIGPLAFDVALYRIDWTDVQVLGAVTPQSGPTLFVTTNGGRARSQGVEWALALRPEKNLTIAWSGNAVDATLRSDVPGIGGSAGDNLPYVPRFTSTVTGDYRIPLTGSVTANLGATWSYVGGRNGDFIAAPLLSNNPHLPAYSTWDLRAGIEVSGITLDAIVRNVSNSRGITGYRSAFGFNGTTGQAAIVQPRSVQVRLSGRF